MVLRRAVHPSRAAFVVAAVLLGACAQNAPKPDEKPKLSLLSPNAYPPGAVARPQDNMYLAVNGEWLAKTEIPADRASWGALSELRDNTLTELRTVIDQVAGAKPATGNPVNERQKIAALYASFLDEERLETLGIKPLAVEMKVVDGLKSKAGIPAVIAHFNQIGVAAPYFVDIDPDKRDPTKNVPILYQSGLGMPDRDYYLKDDDAKLKDTRAKYVAHVAKMLTLAGATDGDAQAQQVLDLETRLARVQWTRVENRDPVKTYNRVPLAQLDAMTPGYAWKTWLADAKIAGRAPAVIVAQPSYFTGFAQVVQDMPVSAWKSYFRYHLLRNAAPYLSRAFVEESFAFTGTVLTGAPANLPRWKRGVSFVESSMGFALGRLYVTDYFPPESKARMDALVKNLLAAYRQSIDGLDWMSAATKKEAQAKLAKFTTKIGYPVKWRDYAKLVVRRGDLVGNLYRARRFEYERENAKLGKPVDRTEWGITPQTVNAYYSGPGNEIVFPAAILQPPFFDPKADDATNYGAIGAVIGHEISHGFDDRGSQFDGDGKLRNWWTDEDRARFNAKTKMLVAQYDAFEPVPGYKVNGLLTLGENIADNAGLAVAYKAYRLSLNGVEPPAVDGFTSDQRFFRGFTAVWRGKRREALEIQLLKTDPHAPDAFRANGSLRNQTPFVDAYQVKPGDAMYLPPDQRVTLW